MLKQIKIYVAIAAAWGIAYVAKDYFGISDIWMGIAAVASMGIVVSINRRRRDQVLDPART